MDHESTPLLSRRLSRSTDTASLAPHHKPDASNAHAQFCMLVGIPPSIPRSDQTSISRPSASTLYQRARKTYRAQVCTYAFTAALSNTLLLSQVVLGATLTALAASESSHVLITIFGVANTIIAGVVAYLKSRGQPMRARMFRDDLEHVVGEIQNSEIMWYGISHGIDGYDEIDTEDKVSVRSEVARLTRLFDGAVKSNTQNNPDLYMTGTVPESKSGLRIKPAPDSALGVQPVSTTPLMPGLASGVESNPPAVPVAAGQDSDESPATAKDVGNIKKVEIPNPDTNASSVSKGKDIEDTDQTVPASQPVQDLPSSPA